MWEAIRRHRMDKRRLRASMRDLARNGYCCTQIHGDVTLMQMLHTWVFGH